MKNSIHSTTPLISRTVFFVVIGFTTLALMIVMSLIFQPNVSARPKFDPGNIITDSSMRAQRMNVKQIQNYLNYKGGACTSGPNCLKNYKQGGKSAAQIIYNAAKKYRINPQVLIVTLEKETGLVTTNNPADWRYRTATGYGCPDSSPGKCNSRYYGFSNQVNWTATMFDAILRNSPTWYTSYTVGQNNIMYHPHNNCGTQRVNIKNRATAALYNYTPYVPNKAALNAGYGTGNRCSSYGNRNFFFLFNDWFSNPAAGEVVGSAKFERLVGASPTVIRGDNGSLANYTKTVSLGNKINTFHYNATKKSLQLTQWNGSRWTTSTIDGPGARSPGAKNNDMGKGIDAFVYKGEVQVYYYDATEKSIRHAWSSGGGSHWKTETLEGSNGALSGYRGSVGRYVKAFQYGSSGIQIFYLDEARGSIRHAWWDVKKQRWGFEDFDGVKGSIGNSTHTVGYRIEGMVWAGHGIQLYYYDSTNKGIRHAWWDAKTQRWGFEDFDGVRGSILNNTNDVGSSISLTVYNKDLQLFYFDRTAGELRHAWWKSKQRRWGNEKFDGANNSVIKNVINAGQQVRATTYQSGLFIFYYDNASYFNDPRTSGWRLAYWQNGQWNGRMYDGGDASVSGSKDPVAGDISFAVHNKGRQLQVFYQDKTGGLRHSWMTR